MQRGHPVYRYRGHIIALVVIVLAGYTIIGGTKLITTDAELPQNFPATGFSYEVLESLLHKYVDSAGHVDYERWHASEPDTQLLDSYIAAVSRFSPENAPQRFPSRDDKLAYWLYSYNAYVIKSILLRWPLESVTDMKAQFEIVRGFGFFYSQRFLFGEETYSLYTIENKKIRGTFNDARIHFVLNCGSESCPVLRPELPTGDKLEPFLTKAAVGFVSERRNVNIDHENRQIVLNEIFKWFRRDFINDLRHRGLPSERGLVDYIVSIAPSPLREEIERAAGYKIVFDDYDWSINESDASL